MLRMRRKPDTPEECIEIFPSSVTASSDSFWWWPTFTPAYNAITSNEDEVWNAGRFAPASIRFSFDTTVRCSRIDLLPHMEPRTGEVEHEFHLMNFASSIKGTATDNEWIHAVFKNTEELQTKSIEIKTVSSPSWVAWRRVRFWKLA